MQYRSLYLGVSFLSHYSKYLVVGFKLPSTISKTNWQKNYSSRFQNIAVVLLLEVYINKEHQFSQETCNNNLFSTYLIVLYGIYTRPTGNLQLQPEKKLPYPVSTTTM
jgi:hypothetical protein